MPTIVRRRASHLPDEPEPFVRTTAPAFFKEVYAVGSVNSQRQSEEMEP